MAALELPEPETMPVRTGVLARTPSDFPYRIGVVGRDDHEARRRFDEAFVAWSRLHDLIEAQRSSLSE